MARRRKVSLFYYLRIFIIIFSLVLLVAFPLSYFNKSEDEFTGEYVVYHFHNEAGDDLDGQVPPQLNADNGKRYMLVMDKTTEAPEVGTRVKIKGKLTDSTITVKKIEQLDESSFEAKDSHAVSGDRSLVIIKFNFLNNKSDPDINNTLVQNITSGTTSINSYMDAISYGEFTGYNPSSIKVVGPVTVNYNTGKCFATVGSYLTFDAWSMDARAQADKIVDVDSYNTKVYLFPKISECEFAGAAYINSDQIWLNGDIRKGVFAHEALHTVGVGHAQSCNDGYPCTNVTKYGDPEDPMGKGFQNLPPHPNGALKWKLDWGNFYSPAVTSQGVQVRLYNIETDYSGTSNIQTISLPKPAPYSLEKYFVTYRNKSDVFDNQSAITKSVAIHIFGTQRPISKDPTERQSDPNSFLVTHLTAGGVFNDTRNDVQVIVVDMTTDYATIEITTSNQTLTNGTPTVASPTPTLTPWVDTGGYVWDTNLKPVSGITIQVEKQFPDGSKKSFYPVTGSNGYFKQGAFVQREETYWVKQASGLKTLTDTQSKDYVTQKDTPMGSALYANQKGAYWDCATIYGDQTFRCNFLKKVNIDTASTIADVSSYVWHPSANPARKYTYRRTYLSTDGRTYYSKTCDFQELIGYPTNCGGYVTSTTDTPGTVKGYSAYTYTGGGKTWLGQFFVASNGTQLYSRRCVLDTSTGGASSCTSYATTTIGAPTGVRSVTAWVYGGKIKEAFFSSDGLKQYSRTCTITTDTGVISACTSYATNALPTAMNGYGAFWFKDGYGRLRLQQFLVKSDGRTPYFRTCGMSTIDSYTCPAFF